MKPAASRHSGKSMSRATLPIYALYINRNKSRAGKAQCGVHTCSTHRRIKQWDDESGGFEGGALWVIAGGGTYAAPSVALRTHLELIKLLTWEQGCRRQTTTADSVLIDETFSWAHRRAALMWAGIPHAFDWISRTLHHQHPPSPIFNHY